jgi:hypothetical protein
MQPQFNFFRGFSIALLIAYTGLLYALVPLVILIVCGMALARWVAKMPVGMVVLNSGMTREDFYCFETYFFQ